MSHPDDSDDDLLRVTREDASAFGEFYSRHEEWVLAYFLKRTRNPEVAADLASETFASALVNVEQFDARRGEAHSWLYGIARNTFASSHRRSRVDYRARRRLGIARLELTDGELERIEELVDAQTGEVSLMLEGLPEEERAAVRARVIDERDYPEIADDLKCSQAAARKRVSRGLARLRTQIKEP